MTGRGVKVTDAIKKKIKEIILKHEKLLTKVNKIEVELKQSNPHKGVDADLKLEITITMPKVIIRVEEVGSDFYSIIDKMDPIIKRRLVRYHDYKRQLEGKESWKIVGRRKFEEAIGELDEDIYASNSDILPVISRFKQFNQNSPMHPAEAIERMELIGHEAFLFKNIETDKYSMVYKRRDGTYGLVEPRES